MKKVVFLYIQTMTSHYLNLEDSHNGIAAVLKTAGFTPVGVRVPHLPQGNKMVLFKVPFFYYICIYFSYLYNKKQQIIFYKMLDNTVKYFSQKFEKPINYITKHRFQIVLLLVFFSALTIAIVYNSVKIDDVNSKIEKNKNKIQELKTEHEILKSEIIQLQSAERIISISEEKFGLKKTTKVPFVIEDNDDNYKKISKDEKKD